MSVDIIKKLSDKYIENLRKPDKIKMGNGWASLHIRIDTMSKEQRELVWEANKLLRKAGIKFDSGCGCGNIDFELDWSLQGAYITVRPIVCSNRDCRKELIFGKKFRKDIIWVRMRRIEDNYIFVYPFCSNECIKNYVKNYEPPIEILGIWRENLKEEDIK